MKELSQYHKMEQIARIDPEPKSGRKVVKHQVHNLEDAYLKKMLGSMTPKRTPFNYEPYVWQSGSETMRYGAMLTDELKTPNTNYSK